MNRYRKKNSLCLSVNMRSLLYPGYGDVTFWYQSSGCYSEDRNEYKVFKCGSEW